MLLSHGLRAAKAASGFLAYAETQNSGTGSTVSVALPYGVRQNDLLLAFALGATNTLTWTGPAGWTEYRDSFTRGWYWKTASATEAGPYVFTASAATNTNLGAILAFRSYQYDSIGSNSVAGANPTITGISVPSNDSIVLAVVAASNSNSDAVSYTFPAGWIKLYENNDGIVPSQAVGMRYFNAGFTGSILVNGTAGVASSGTLVCLTRL